jgi:hypothetical protein
VSNHRDEPPDGTVVTPTRSQELAFVKSVIYASLFDYPLTLAQVHATLVEIRADEQAVASWWRNSAFLQATVEHRDGWYFPAGRADLLATRARREAVSRELLARDARILSLISRLPFVRMVALSGSLAHLNAEGSADLDLFVITAPGRVWSVTLATLLLTKLLGCRRHVCMNYVVSERQLAIAPQDLFSANQIIHLRPISGHDVFARFLAANAFVNSIYPNFATAVRCGVNEEAYPKPQVPSPRSLERALAPMAPLAERVARGIYRRHLEARAEQWRSRAQVRMDEECLKLHTTSHRAATMAAFDAAMNAALNKHHEEHEGTKDTLSNASVLLSSTGV